MLAEPWRITLMGGLRAERGGYTITRFKYQKVGGLLGYLAYHLPQVHSREVLIDLFWPESAPEAGRNNLSVALSSLRNQFEPPGTPAHAVLRADRFSIGLNPQAVTTDVADFESAIKAAARAGSGAERVQSLERAADLYRGRLLPGMFEEWILPEETRLAGLYFDAVSALITHLEESGRSGEALRYARRAVSVDPLREEAHAHLMRLLAATGQPGAALRQYRELERLLDEEMGEEPSAPLRAQARQIEKESGLSAPAVPPARSSGSPGVEPLSGLTLGPGRPATLTFLVTDIEGSTPLWEQQGEPFREALQTHHAALRAIFARHDGQELSEAGDAFLVAFLSARQALTCALAGQQALAEAAWPSEIGPLQVRMAVHTGDVTPEGGDYHGLALHHASRILRAAHGGQILVSEATAALMRGVPGDDLRLVDLGIWRLREAAAPQRLFQLEYPGMDAAFPAPSAAAGYQPGLPLQSTRFFGREAEIAALLALLTEGIGYRVSGVGEKTEEDRGRKGEGERQRRGVDSAISDTRHPTPDTRLVTLTGPGGTGKSRLAVAVAERLLEMFQGAVWFVPLADLADPERIADTILDVLRLPRSLRQEPLEQVVQALSRQPSLLILDNFEHLLTPRASAEGERGKGKGEREEEGNPKSEGGGAWVVQALLARVPALCLLVTSRQALSLPGEQEFPVPPLPTPNGGEPPEQLSVFDSVRLFVDRAQAVLPYFQVTNTNAPAVAALCDRLEGLPLAIELAAARAQVLTPQQMLAQLANRFEFLTSRKRGGEERHRTLRAAIDWSYRLLTPELQRFFARLSVFRGGWTVEAAEAVCEAPLALDYLAELREGSLITSGETDQGMRFRMLETLREYAQEWLAEAVEVAACRKRQTDYFLDLAEQAEPELQGLEQDRWLERLETEHDNLRTALEWCRTAEDSAESGLRLAAALYRFWVMRGPFTEGRTQLAAALSREGAQEPTEARAKALNSAGGLAGMQGDLDAQRTFHEEGLAIRREIGDQAGIAQSLANLGYVAVSQGNYASATPLIEESLALFRELGNKRGIAHALANLGRANSNQGDFAAAQIYYEQSLAIFQELDDKAFRGYLLNNLGTVAIAQGEYATARALLEESLAIKHELGDKWGIAESLVNLGLAAERQGDYAAAMALDEECLAIYRELGDKEGIAAALNNLGTVFKRQGDDAAARALYEEALGIDREIGNRAWEAVNLNNLGEVAKDQGDYAKAYSLYKESLTIVRELGVKREIAEGLESCAALAAEKGEPERAARLYGAAEALREEIGAPLAPNAREGYERNLAAVRESLEEAEFVVAWEAGHAMTWEQAVEYALSLDKD